MSDEVLPSVVREDAFRIFGVWIRCYVLDDGQRILNADDVHELFASMAEGLTSMPDGDEMTRLAAWMRGQG